jgi:hypothetical protein
VHTLAIARGAYTLSLAQIAVTATGTLQTVTIGTTSYSLLVLQNYPLSYRSIILLKRRGHSMMLDKLGNKPASWVIVSKQTGQAIRETFNSSLLTLVNTDKYTVMPIYDYLSEFNRGIK